MKQPLNSKRTVMQILLWELLILLTQITKIPIMNRNLHPSSENSDLSQTKKITSKGKYIRSRRRPTAVVKALTSSDIAAKYKLLIDNRLAIAERDLSWAKEKQSLEKENLLLDIEIKKEKLKQLQNNKNLI
jgi:hypothetical protein